MNGLIRGQDAMDAICGSCLRRDESVLDGCIGEQCAAKSALESLPTVGAEPEWIPCSERLPEEDGAYLVTNSRWGAPLLEVVYWITDGFQSKHKPIAWIPLPPAWEGEERDT